jgi:hypothetical protein
MIDRSLLSASTRLPIVVGAALFLLATAPLCGHAGPAEAELMRSADLNGKAVSLPADLPAPKTIVLIAFRHEDQGLLERWRAELDLTDENPAWIEVPVVGVSNPLIVSIIRAGMRGRHQTATGRAHIVPAFGDAVRLARSLDVPSGLVSVLVMDRTGHVLAKADGAASPEKVQQISAGLQPSSERRP